MLTWTPWLWDWPEPEEVAMFIGCIAAEPTIHIQCIAGDPMAAATIGAGLVLYRQNVQIVTLKGVADFAGNPITDANITGTLVDSRSGNPIMSVDEAGLPTEPITISFQPDPFVDGNFTALLTSDFSPPIGNYRLVLRGTDNAAGGAFKMSVAIQVARRMLDVCTPSLAAVFARK